MTFNFDECKRWEDHTPDEKMQAMVEHEMLNMAHHFEEEIMDARVNANSKACMYEWIAMEAHGDDDLRFNVWDLARKFREKRDTALTFDEWWDMKCEFENPDL